MFTIGRIGDDWNRHATRDRIRSFVEREWNRQLERALLPSLFGSKLSTLLFIKARTLGWQKFAEVIPMHHFISGMLDEDGEVRLGQDLRPLCSGSGIKKEDTVRAAWKGLEQAGLITKLPGPGGIGVSVNVFMPCSQDWLARKMLEAGAGVVPAHLSTYFAGEHIQAPDGAPWEVQKVEPGQLTVTEITAVGQYVGRPRLISPSVAPRIPLNVWLDFIGEEPKSNQSSSSFSARQIGSVRR